MNEGDIHITVTMPSAVSLERGAEVLREMRLALLKFPEVKDVLTEQGHPEDGTDDEAPNQSETFVIMKPETRVATTGRSEGADRRGDARRARQRPGVDYNFSQPIKDRVEESISGIRGQVVVKIYGDDLAPDAREAGRGEDDHRRARAARATSTSTGRAARSTSSPTSIARRRRATACRCATSRTRSRARTAASWRPTMWEGERSVGVRVKTPIAGRGRPGVGRAAGDPDASTRACSWRALAKLHLDSGRTQINREQGRRFLALKCNIEGRDMGSFVAEAQARVAATVKLPEGYYLTWGGEFENQRRAMKRLAFIVPISVLVIFFLLYMTFRAALPALVVLLDVPFATVGGVFALYLTGTELSVSSAVGFITLFGVSVMNGVLIVNYMRRARANPAATPETRDARGRRSGCGPC